GPSSVRSTPVLPARPGSSAAPPACAWGRSSLRLFFLIDGGFFLRLFSGARLLFQLAADRGAALAQLFGTVLAGQDGDIGAGQFLHAGDRQTAERQQRHQLVMGLGACAGQKVRSEEHTSELQSRFDLVCRLLLEKKKINTNLNESVVNSRGDNT